MPGWAQGMRLDEVRPTFDVFSLGKLLWSMVSGKPRLRLWYFDHPEFDLLKMFPQDLTMNLIQRILENTVVEHESQIQFRNANELWLMVDSTIEALESGGSVPSRRRPMRCHFCGVGTYQARIELDRKDFHDPADHQYSFICNNCGHLEQFYWTKNQAPPGWVE